MAATLHAARVLEHAAGGRYEEALGVEHDAPREEINRAHVRALFRFRGDTAALEALNRVKGLLADETPVDKARRLLRLERREEALWHLVRALEGSAGGGLPERDRAEAHHLAGWVLFQLGRNREALPHFESAARLRGGAADEIWLGNALERLDRLEEALERYRKAVDSRGHATERMLLCKALLRLGRWEEALPHFERTRCGPADSPDLAALVNRLNARRRRARLRGSLHRAAGFARREPLDFLLAGLALAYGFYFLFSLVH